MKKVRFIGLNVHADTIAVAVAEPGGDVRSLGSIPNRPESIRRQVKKVGLAKELRVCYEAGPRVTWSLPPANEFREEVLFAGVRPSGVSGAPLEADLSRNAEGF